MSTSSPPPHRLTLPSSSILDTLYEDEDIEDIVAITGSTAPDWLKRLTIPTNWQVLKLPDGPEQTSARIAVFGPLGNSEWQAADTVNVTGFTGWPSFYDVYHSADSVLRGLRSTDIVTRALPVPPIRWTAAMRSCGTAFVDDRRVWLQQSHYVASSEQPHASRLTVHTTLVDSTARERLAQNITQLTDEVYNGFLSALPEKRRAN